MEIDLGQKWDGPSTCCCPPPPEKESNVHYPGVYLTLPEGEELPDSGEITFKFRVTRETEEKKGEKCCKYDLDLMKITAVKADAGSDDGEDDDAAERIEKAFKGKKRDA